MRPQIDSLCNKTECSDLLKELADLKEQLRKSEDQLQAIEPAQHSSTPSADNTMPFLDSRFDVGDTADVIPSAKENAPSTFQSERQLFLERVSKLVYQSDDHRSKSGTLLLCEFSNITVGNTEVNERDLTLNEASMIDRLMNACTRQGDLIGFISHFERAIFIPADADGAIAGMVSDKLIRATKKYQAPKPLNGIRYKCSIGISIFPNDTADIDTLFRYADRAAYASIKMEDSYYSYYL